MCYLCHFTFYYLVFLNTAINPLSILQLSICQIRTLKTHNFMYNCIISKMQMDMCMGTQSKDLDGDCCNMGRTQPMDLNEYCRKKISFFLFFFIYIFYSRLRNVFSSIKPTTNENFGESNFCIQFETIIQTREYYNLTYPVLIY